jgi:hypothetical protein
MPYLFDCGYVVHFANQTARQMVQYGKLCATSLLELRQVKLEVGSVRQQAFKGKHGSVTDKVKTFYRGLPHEMSGEVLRCGFGTGPGDLQFWPLYLVCILPKGGFLFTPHLLTDVIVERDSETDKILFNARIEPTNNLRRVVYYRFDCPWVLNGTLVNSLGAYLFPDDEEEDDEYDDEEEDDEYNKALIAPPPPALLTPMPIAASGAAFSYTGASFPKPKPKKKAKLKKVVAVQLTFTDAQRIPLGVKRSVDFNEEG